MENRVIDDDYDEEAPPSYADATGSSSNPAPPQYQNGYFDEKQRIRESMSSASGSSRIIESSRGAHEFVVDFKKPMLDFWTVDVVPSQPMPNLSRWQMKYSEKKRATMHRYAPEPRSNVPLKEVADVLLLWPGMGADITFWPHEEAVDGREGGSNAETCFMQYSRWSLTTKFTIALPLLKAVTWVVPRRKQAELGEEQESMSPTGLTPVQSQDFAAQSESSRRGSSSKAMSPKGSGRSSSWTPFPTQHLLGDCPQRLLATYTRAAPWSKHEGYLSLVTPPWGLSAAIIEEIVIVTAAMVGLQDAVGMSSSLMESGLHSIRGKGKEKRRDTE